MVSIGNGKVIGVMSGDKGVSKCPDCVEFIEWVYDYQRSGWFKFSFTGKVIEEHKCQCNVS